MTEMVPTGARVRIKPPLVFFPIGLAALALKWVAPFHVPLPASIRWAAGGLLVAGGVALHAATMTQFRRTGQNPLPGNPAPALILKGPYRFSRNPMYLAVVTWMFGLALLLDDAWIAAGALASLAIVHFTSVLAEETYLETRFGEPYRE